MFGSGNETSNFLAIDSLNLPHSLNSLESLVSLNLPISLNHPTHWIHQTQCTHQTRWTLPCRLTGLTGLSTLTKLTRLTRLIELTELNLNTLKELTVLDSTDSATFSLTNSLVPTFTGSVQNYSHSFTQKTRSQTPYLIPRYRTTEGVRAAEEIRCLCTTSDCVRTVVVCA